MADGSSSACRSRTSRYGGITMARIPHEESSGNVFADFGFTPAQAADLTAKSTLIIAIKDVIKRRKLTQQEGGTALRHRPAHAVQGVPRPDGERDDRSACELAERPRSGCRDHRQARSALPPARAPSRRSCLKGGVNLSCADTVTVSVCSKMMAAGPGKNTGPGVCGQNNALPDWLRLLPM